ncbi:hypothetical protein BRPE64_CCDS06510 [Caballeronia insecticola]|uniref:Uncharacterized protein n=1 Tax=Caballeronia insecticola TaxID=758793 RepID=R4WQC0_9BURK|nr:hypothetical protein BRPE64_CCDS06510 [Caballeronia insecticola]
MRRASHDDDLQFRYVWGAGSQPVDEMQFRAVNTYRPIRIKYLAMQG